MQKYFYIIVFLIALGCCLFSAVKTAHASNAMNVDATLSQLEDKFFEHQYNSDADIDRLNRLEQFVYGDTQAGSMDARLKKLLSTIPSEPTDQPNTAGEARPASTSAPSTANLPSSNRFDYGSYPRVTDLEQELLGHTYATDSLPDRLARLETKAYGAPSSSTDLCQRVDLLDDYAQRHDIYGEHNSANVPQTATTFNPTTPIAAAAVPVNAPRSLTGPRARYQDPWNTPAERPTQTEYTSSTGTFIGSAEERVSMMEAQVFHHTSTDKPLDERLNKLEKKILPNENIASLSPTAQTVKLWDTLHPKETNQVAVLADNDTGTTNDPTAGNSDNTAAAAPNRRSWLHRLATAGGSFAGTSMSPNGSNSGMQTNYGTNASYIPGMFSPNSRFVGASVGPGAGPAGLPVGFW